MKRSCRSFISTQRRQVIRRGSMLQGIALVNVVVDHGGQQVVGRTDGVEVAGEVEVDVLHGHHLGITAASGAALYAEHRPQRGLTQGDNHLLAQAMKSVRPDQPW